MPETTEIHGFPARLATIALVVLLGGLVSCGDNMTQPSTTTHSAYQPGTTAPLQCVPNLDGKIVSSEMKPVLGVAASYLINPVKTTRTVDLTGQDIGSGQRYWDWSKNYSDDQILKVKATALTGKWYASSFPNGQFVTPLDAADTVDAIYRQDDQALWLLGLASATKNPSTGKTLVVYQSPVALIRFPIKAGAQWSSVGLARNSMVRGLPYAGQDTYDVKVIATGKLKLPIYTFDQVYEVETHVINQPAVGQSSSHWQVSFLSECFGEVARATSKNGASADFSTAVELRRLGAQ